MEVSRLEARAAGYLTMLRLVGHYDITQRAEVGTLLNIELTGTPLCFPNDDDAESIAITGCDAARLILEEVLSPASLPAIKRYFDLMASRNVPPTDDAAATQAMMDALKASAEAGPRTNLIKDSMRLSQDAAARRALLLLNRGYLGLAA
jgi:hypothetical protein